MDHLRVQLWKVSGRTTGQTVQLRQLVKYNTTTYCFGTRLAVGWTVAVDFVISFQLRFKCLFTHLLLYLNESSYFSGTTSLSSHV